MVRGSFDVKDSILWTQRIQREQSTASKAKTGEFSVRAAVRVADVPAKFKPGHVDPHRECGRIDGFDPAAHGWDPSGKEAAEFRRAMVFQTSGPQLRHAFPETAQQEMGWVLAPIGAGDRAERLRHRKLRLGIGWEYKHPDQWSASTAVAPPVPALEKAEVRTELSVIPPSLLSATAPAGGCGAQDSLLSRASASHLLASVPSGGSVSSSLSKASSLPALGPVTAERLKRREEKLARVVKENEEYLCVGARGHKWYRPLGQTDVTSFANEFAKATGGVPLYKYS